MSPPSAVAESTLPPRIQHLAERIRPVAEEESRLIGLYLFGSRASGEEHEASDVDLGALFSAPVDLRDQLDLQGRLEDALGCPVDLVDAGRARPYLALDIIRGERLYATDPEACDRFDLYVLRRAADLAPFERRRRRMIFEQARRGTRNREKAP